MEFSNTHVAALNLKLPAGFVIEQMPVEELRAKRPEPEKLRAEVKFHAPSSTLPPYRTERDTVTPSVPKTPKSEGFRKVQSILQKLKSHPSIGSFSSPRRQAKDPRLFRYHPLSHRLVPGKKKLTSEKYASSKEFAADIRKMWSNSFLYNSRGTDIYVATIDLSAYFENLIKGNEDISLKSGPEIILPKIMTSSQAESEFTEQKKRQLGSRIKMLHPKFFKGVYDIVKNASGAGEKGDEFEFDIDLLPTSVCRQLDEYTSQCLSATLALSPAGTQSKSTGLGEPPGSDSSDSEDEPFTPTDNIDGEDSQKSSSELWLEQKSTSLEE